MTAIPSAVRLRRPRIPFRRRCGRLTAALLVLALSVIAVVGVPASLALFTDSESIAATTAAKSIFSTTRSTTAFDVSDRSSGTVVNASSPLAFGSDGLTFTTSAWATAFASDRYVEVDLNDPLPGGLAVSSPTFTFRFASGAVGATACFYFEVRRASDGAVLATHGSGGSPIGCVTGTTPSAFSTAVASVTSTTVSNDLRVRVYSRDSGSNGMIVDRAVVTGTLYDAFTLHVVRTVDAADTTAATTVWELDGP